MESFWERILKFLGKIILFQGGNLPINKGSLPSSDLNKFLSDNSLFMFLSSSKPDYQPPLSENSSRINLNPEIKV